MSFSDLGLKPEILRAVQDAGYTTPTPIQEQAIPYVLQGRDVLGIAQTGTGKTAGFTLPMLEILSTGRARARMPRSLILEPTRELAAQVGQNFETYGKYEKLTYALLIGGERFEEQVRKLDRGVDVLIATPGRMLDLFERGKVLLAAVKILVIDESDRMLDMGFIPDIEKIVSKLPAMRQTLFFSATMPPEIKRLTQTFLTNPKQIAVAPPSTAAANVEQFLVTVDRVDKRDALRKLLQRENVRNALVFCNRKRDVGIVFRSLERHGFNVGQLHGDMQQSIRTETLGKFKAGDIQILVCSDVAARGLDISELSHVFNFDVPTTADDYIHRIGRTARAGRSGRAFSLATSEDRKFVAAIAKLIGKSIPPATVDGDAVIAAPSETTGDTTSVGDGDAQLISSPAAADTPAPAIAEEGKTGGRRRRGRQSARTKEDSGRDARRPAAKDVLEEAPGATLDTQTSAASAAPAGASEAASGDPPRSNRAGEPKRRNPKRERGQGSRSGNRGGKPEPRDDAVVGLGDHTPAFLLRPVRGIAAGS